MVASNLDFVVVMDPEGIRYSHADPSYIGLPFSSHEDVKKVIGGQEFFSEKEGMLGSASAISSLFIMIKRLLVQFVLA